MYKFRTFLNLPRVSYQVGHHIIVSAHLKLNHWSFFVEVNVINARYKNKQQYNLKTTPPPPNVCMPPSPPEYDPDYSDNRIIAFQIACQVLFSDSRQSYLPHNRISKYPFKEFFPELFDIYFVGDKIANDHMQEEGFRLEPPPT